MAAKGEENTGVIQKIQRRSGCLLLVIGAAMLAFVLTDIISGLGRSFGMNENVVGEIAGDQISLEEYNQAVRVEIDKYKRLNPNLQVDNKFQEQIREQVWNRMIQDNILEKQYDELGIAVSGDEFWAAAVEDPQIIQAFADSSGQFNKNQFRQFLEVRMQEDENLYYTWKIAFENPLIDKLKAAKYRSLLNAGIYGTTLDAKADYNYRNIGVQAKVVGVPYVAVSDSTIEITDEELQNYINEHPKEYEMDAFRNIEFAVLNITPTAADSASVIKELDDDRPRFQKAENDSAFVSLYQSTTPYSAAYVSRGSGRFSDEVEDMLFAADSGQIVGPVLTNEGAYALHKISGVERDSLASIRAKHILLLVDGSTPQDTANTRKQALELIGKLKTGETTFDKEAIGNIDRTGNAGGDLGWMKKIGYARHPKVRDELFKKSHKKGDMFIVTSSFGVHVVEVTSNPSYKKIQVATYSKNINPSNETNRAVEKMANDIFYESTKEEGDFRDAVQSKGLNVNEANRVTEKDESITGIKIAKNAIRWIYEGDRKVGDVSDPMFMQDQFVIVKVTKIVEEGLAKVDDVRDRVTNDYLNEKKAEILKKQFVDAMGGASSIDDVATAMNTEVRIVPSAIMQESAVTGVGADEKIMGYLHGLPEGQISEPIAGNSGVYVIQVEGQVKVGDLPEFKPEEAKQMVKQELMGGSVEETAVTALRDAYGVKDERYKFF